ncbi:hypothetical protein ACFWOG_40130 [Kitasatospora sp. NPDC058406]|uniref:hypothetical protein n=1 Tax=Kitasatospora sp. NPDC058406 TaxID=3346483 RepID=UPI0036693C2D
MNRTVSLRRAAAPAALVLTAVTVFGALGAGSASATPSRPPTASCNPNLDSVWTDVTAAQVDPVVTDFLAVNIADGTTGQRTETLTQVDSVTTQVNASTEITASTGFLFVKVSAKVGFSVQNTTSTIRTNAITSTWNFNKAGYYGL